MKYFILAIVSFSVLLSSETTLAEPEYTRIEMEIDVEKSASDLWARVGDYCAIREWANIDCEITSGEGEMGTVRELIGGQIIEILVAKTDLSYGYTQPINEGDFYNLYHAERK